MQISTNAYNQFLNRVAKSKNCASEDVDLRNVLFKATQNQSLLLALIQIWKPIVISESLILFKLL